MEKWWGIAGVTITGVFSVISAYAGAIWGQNNFSVNVNMNGNTIEMNGKDIPDLLSENDELKNKIETLQGELQGLQDALQGKEEGLGKLSEAQKDIVPDINLVIDNVDSKQTYAGIIHNGELLISTAALQDYFNEPVYWDSAHTTIYVGENADKPAKEISLWDKNYLDAAKPEHLISDIDNNTFGFELLYKDKKADNYIVYPLNGKAVKVSGDFHVYFYNGKHSDVQIVVNLLNENDEVLYTSPIISLLAPDLHFEVETKDCLKLKIAVEAVAARNFWDYEIDEFYVRNLTAVTTEY